MTMISNEKNYDALVPASGNATYTVTFSATGCEITGNSLADPNKSALETELFETVGNFKAKSKTATGHDIQFTVSSLGKVSATFNGATPKYVDTFTIE